MLNYQTISRYFHSTERSILSVNSGEGRIVIAIENRLLSLPGQLKLVENQ